MAGKKFLTRDMIVAAREKGWSVTITAQHYGMHRKSIDAACERFGVDLPQSKFSPQLVSAKSKEEPSNRRVPSFSCSPKAIQRYLVNGK
jgi:hypothetical protein